MPRTRTGKKSVAIEIVTTPDKFLGMKTRKGTILQAGGRCYFKTAGRKAEVPIITNSQQAIRKLAGKEVYAVYSLRKPGEIVAIGTWPTPERPQLKKIWILCYIPAIDMIRRIDESVRQTLLRGFVKEGIITSRLGRMFSNER